MLARYPKEIVSADGTRLILRPVVREDEKGLIQFFARIPEEERWFRRHNLADPVVLKEWLGDLGQGRIILIVAVNPRDHEIVANVRLHRRPTACLSHLAHLRIMVDPKYRNQRIGNQIILDVIELAKSMGLEKLVAEYVSDVEETAIKASSKQDFYQQAVLKDYVKDHNGNYHDLIIMVKTLHHDLSDF